MPASKKEGGKNRKIGRHSRNPSSKLQAARTARNKAKRSDTHAVASAQPHDYPKPRPLSREELRAQERVVFSGIVADNHATHILICDGVTIDTGSHFQVSNSAAHLRKPGNIYKLAGR